MGIRTPPFNFTGIEFDVIRNRMRLHQMIYMENWCPLSKTAKFENY